MICVVVGARSSKKRGSNNEALSFLSFYICTQTPPPRPAPHTHTMSDRLDGDLYSLIK